MDPQAESNAPLSGVRVVTSTRGYDVAVHAYVGTTREQLQTAGDLALEEWLRLHALLKQRIAEANQQGVDSFAAELKRRSA